MPRTIARRRARAGDCAAATRRKARASRSSPAAIPACSPWRRRCARRSRPGPTAGATLDVAIVPGITAMLAVAARVGAPLGHDFCAHVAVRQSQAVGADRAAARCRGRRGLRHRALQSGIAGAAVAARPGARAAARGICRHDAGRYSAARSGRPDESVRRHDARRGRPASRRHGDAGHRRLARDARRSRAPGERRWSTRRAPPPR